MRSNFANVTNSVLESRSRVQMRGFFFILCHTLVLVGDSSNISGNVNSPLFSAKNASVTLKLDSRNVVCCL